MQILLALRDSERFRKVSADKGWEIETFFTNHKQSSVNEGLAVDADKNHSVLAFIVIFFQAFDEVV